MTSDMVQPGLLGDMQENIFSVLPGVPSLSDIFPQRGDTF
jgi:hypothetical protein